MLNSCLYITNLTSTAVKTIVRITNKEKTPKKIKLSNYLRTDDYDQTNHQYSLYQRKIYHMNMNKRQKNKNTKPQLTCYQD